MIADSENEKNIRALEETAKAAGACNWNGKLAAHQAANVDIAIMAIAAVTGSFENIFAARSAGEEDDAVKAHVRLMSELKSVLDYFAGKPWARIPEELKRAA